MVKLNVLHDAGQIAKLSRHATYLTLLIYRGGMYLAIMTHGDFRAFYQKAGVGTVSKVLRQIEDGHFVFVRTTLPWAELRTVATLITVRINVQCLITVFKAGHWDRDIGTVRAYIHALATDVVTFQAT